jgi:hypothetical protein
MHYCWEIKDKNEGQLFLRRSFGASTDREPPGFFRYLGCGWPCLVRKVHVIACASSFAEVAHQLTH